MAERSEKIRKIVAIADMEERKVGQKMGESRQHLESQVDRLGELNAYRQVYAEKTRHMNKISPVRWHDYQVFLAKLDEAVAAQQQLINDGEQVVNAHRRRWLVKRQRLESLRRVLDRYVDEELSAATRAEQRVLDDLPKAPQRYADDNDER